jgi:hypothetical protein
MAFNRQQRRFLGRVRKDINCLDRPVFEAGPILLTRPKVDRGVDLYWATAVDGYRTYLDSYDVEIVAEFPEDLNEEGWRPLQWDRKD